MDGSPGRQKGQENKQLGGNLRDCENLRDCPHVSGEIVPREGNTFEKENPPLWDGGLSEDFAGSALNGSAFLQATWAVNQYRWRVGQVLFAYRLHLETGRLCDAGAGAANDLNSQFEILRDHVATAAAVYRQCYASAVRDAFPRYIGCTFDEFEEALTEVSDLLGEPIGYWGGVR